MSGGPAGDNVFQDVAQAGPEVFAFIHAAGVFHETANRGHGRHVVFLHDDRQPVGKRGEGHVVGQSAKLGVFSNGVLAFGGRFRLDRPPSGVRLRDKNLM